MHTRADVEAKLGDCQTEKMDHPSSASAFRVVTGASCENGNSPRERLRALTIERALLEAENVRLMVESSEEHRAICEEIRLLKEEIENGAQDWRLDTNLQWAEDVPA